MALIKEIVIDSVLPSALARLWAAALDDYDVRPYDEAELRRLADLGLTPATDPSVALDGPGPTIFFQEAREPKQDRNPVHLDLACENLARECERLVTLGATVRDVHEGYTVMLDPEGNEFCLKNP